MHACACPHLHPEQHLLSDVAGNELFPLEVSGERLISGDRKTGFKFQCNLC